MSLLIFPGACPCLCPCDWRERWRKERNASHRCAPATTKGDAWLNSVTVPLGQTGWRIIANMSTHTGGDHTTNTANWRWPRRTGTWRMARFKSWVELVGATDGSVQLRPETSSGNNDRHHTTRVDTFVAFHRNFGGAALSRRQCPLLKADNRPPPTNAVCFVEVC